MCKMPRPAWGTGSLPCRAHRCSKLVITSHAAGPWIWHAMSCHGSLGPAPPRHARQTLDSCRVGDPAMAIAAVQNCFL